MPKPKKGKRLGGSRPPAPDPGEPGHQPVRARADHHHRDQGMMRPVAEKLITKASVETCTTPSRGPQDHPTTSRRAHPLHRDRADVRRASGRLHPHHQDRSAQGRQRPHRRSSSWSTSAYSRKAASTKKRRRLLLPRLRPLRTRRLPPRRPTEPRRPRPRTWPRSTADRGRRRRSTCRATTPARTRRGERRRGSRGLPVKGNENSMKFHEPDSQWYSQTVAEVWFDSVSPPS